MGAGKGYFTDYPKHVGFILGNEFCERFSFYGMKAILVIFLTRALDYSEDDATAIYHGFNMADYFTPLFGALLADGYLGHYKTIFSISIVYAIGNVIMAVGAIPFAGRGFIKALPFTGLVLIAIGTGGIKPCVAAFGADQFEDHQVRQKQAFFSMFYMAINVGSLISMIVTPLIRSNVVCFNDECYALAFGIPAALMVIAVCLFVVGTHWYKINPPGENVIGKLFGCIGTAIKGKCCCSNNEEKREHWLDYADSKYDKDFVADVKSVMRVLFMFIPLPMFYALFDQQGSRWILQSGRMDGDFGGFVLEPDLLPVVNPIFVVMLVPITESLVFPCFKKLNIPNSPLQRLGLGMFLAGTAFMMSGLLQLAIDNSMPPPVLKGEARFKIINAIPCDIQVMINASNHQFDIPYDKRLDIVNLEPVNVVAENYTFTLNADNCKGSVSTGQFTETFSLDQGSYNVIAYWDKDESNPAQLMANKKSRSAESERFFYLQLEPPGSPRWQSLQTFAKVPQSLTKRTEKGEATMQFFNTWDRDMEINIKKKSVNATRLQMSDPIEVPHSSKLAIEGEEFVTKAGAVYTMVLHYSSTNASTDVETISQYQDISPNSVNILFMLPQYFVMSLGEIFFSVTGLSFAYSQSPPTMKAVLQAAWLLCASFGNLIVMVITAIGQLPNQMAEFFMFGALMYVTVIIFAIMSLSYVYVDGSDEAQEDSFGEKSDASEGHDNLSFGPDELPPKYDVVIPDGESPFVSTHM